MQRTLWGGVIFSGGRGGKREGLGLGGGRREKKRDTVYMVIGVSSCRADPSSPRGVVVELSGLNCQERRGFDRLIQIITLTAIDA